MAPKTGGAAYTADRPTAVTCPEACERLYRGLFDSVPTSIWEEDASEVKAYLEDLMRSGAGDLRTYFDYHPEEVARCAAKVRVLSVNAATVAVYEAPDEKALLANIDKVLCEESYDVLKQVLIAVAEGRTEFEAEAFNRTFTGKKKHFRMRWLVAPGFEETYERIWVSMTDLTEHEHFARELDDTGRRYSTLTQHVQDVIWTMDMGLNLTFIALRWRACWGTSRKRWRASTTANC